MGHPPILTQLPQHPQPSSHLRELTPLVHSISGTAALADLPTQFYWRFFDFHLSLDYCGFTARPLSNFFDVDHLALALDFSMHMQDALLDALASSPILTATERVSLTTAIKKNQYSLHFVVYGHRCYVLGPKLARFLHAAYYDSQASTPVSYTHLTLPTNREV